jgi:hypothetical protein
MGLETAAIVMATVAVGAEVGKSVFEFQAANAKEHALDLQAKEMELQTQQKTLSNYDVMEKVLDAQIAHMTTTGAAFSSPSFNAIQRGTLNIGSKKQKNINIEGELAQENIDIEKQNVRNTLFSQLFGNAANAAMSTASVASKMPSLSEA